MKLFNKKITIGTVISLVGAFIVSIFISLIVIAFLSISQLDQATTLNNHSYQVVSAIDDLYEDLLNAQTGSRGYVITGDMSFLEPYNTALPSIGHNFLVLQNLTKDNPEQQERLVTMKSLIDDDLVVLKSFITLRREQGLEAASVVVSQGQGKQLMDSIRKLMTDISDEEESIAQLRLADVMKKTSSISLVLVLGGILGFVFSIFAVYLFWTINRDIKIRKKEVEAMRQIQLVVNNSYDAIIGETLDGIITSWNRGAERMLGYSAQEVIGKSVTLLLPPKMKDEVSALLNKVKAGEWVADYDTVRLRKDGSSIDVALSISPIKTEDGTVIGASVVERDITERKKSEEAMRQIQLIVENSHDAIIGETLDGIITTWNSGAAKMFGYASDEMVKQSAVNLFPPELKDELPRLLERVKRGEIITNYDSIWIKKDKTRADVEFSLSPVHTHVEFSISPVHNDQGEIIGASLICRDITIRKKKEEAMRQIQLIVEDSHDAIIGKTLDGIITSWNDGATKMFGYSPDEVIGKPMTNLFPLELKEELPKLLEQVRQGQVIADYDSIWLRKDGVRADVEFSISPVHDEQGVITGASLVGRDITLRKESDRHIKELNEVRSKFIDIISHQLRTPLTAVNWNLEMLLNGDFGKLKEIQLNFLQATHLSSKEITNRIHYLLTAMDIEEGRVRYETGEVALYNLCNGVVDEIQKKCDLKDLSCVYTPPIKNLPSIIGDGEKIRMVIAILLENAVGYTKNGGKVTTSLKLKGEMARFEVTDTGIGIPESEEHQIFTRFFRASNASVMQPDAFGLGLYIAKNFIEQHHGTIGFESKEGKGSTFWFEIPLKNTGIVKKTAVPVKEKVVVKKSVPTKKVEDVK